MKRGAQEKLNRLPNEANVGAQNRSFQGRILAQFWHSEDDFANDGDAEWWQVS